MEQENEIKSRLIDDLKAENRFWSYNQASIQDVDDDVLIEMVLLYLDINQIDLLFKIYPYHKIKKAWLERLVTQGDYYFTLNKFLAWYYFHAKRPGMYVRAMATRQLNRMASYTKV